MGLQGILGLIPMVGEVCIPGPIDVGQDRLDVLKVDCSRM